MLLSALVLLTALLPLAEEGLQVRLDAALAPAPPTVAALDGAAEPAPAPRYDGANRAVSNWRGQTRAHLVPRALALTASLSDDPPYAARCVRLNNGWCIKSARWSGEVGADAEGHTAFATLADSADAAAGLLRRYVVTYGRRTALAIVRRWAPAECGTGGPAAGATRAAQAPTPAVSAALAPRGLGRTLRARYLAGRRPGGARRAGPGGLRVQPWSPLALGAGRLGAGRLGTRRGPRPAHVATVAAPVAAPDIAVGIGAAAGSPTAGRSPGRPARGVDDPAALLDRGGGGRVPGPARMVAESALLPAIAAGLPVLDLRDLRAASPLCASDGVRIRAYAARIGASVGRGPDEDLDLFGPDGAPRAPLAPVMLAMSAVELGALRASPALVAAAILRLAPPAAPAGPPVAGAPP